MEVAVSSIHPGNEVELCLWAAAARPEVVPSHIASLGTLFKLSHSHLCLGVSLTLMGTCQLDDPDILIRGSNDEDAMHVPPILTPRTPPFLLPHTNEGFGNSSCGRMPSAKYQKTWHVKVMLRQRSVTF